MSPKHQVPMTDEEIEELLAQTQTEGYPSDVRRLVHAVQSAEWERCIDPCFTTKELHQCD